MGFLRRLFCRNFSEVNEALRALDERVSKIEGVGGSFEPKRDVKAGQKATVKNLAPPQNSTDAARYNGSTRFGSYNFFLNGALDGSTTKYIVDTQSGSNAGSVYTAPVDMRLKKLHIAGRESPAMRTNQYLSAALYGGNKPFNLIGFKNSAILQLWPRGANNTFIGTYALVEPTDTQLWSGGYLRKGQWFGIGIGSATNVGWNDISVILEFEKIDR